MNDQPKSFLRRWWRFFSIVFAIVCIIIIVANISLEAFVDSLMTLDPILMAVAFGLNVAVYWLMAVRWRLLYNAVDVRPTYMRLVKVTLVSVFFNTILPSVVGGDAYRTLQLRKYAQNDATIENSFAIVFVDRIVGLVGLMIFGCIGIALNATGGTSPVVIAVTVVSLFILTVILYLSMQPDTYDLILKGFFWLPIEHRQVIERILDRIYANISIYSTHKALLIQAIAMSLLLRFCWFVAGYYIGLALSLELSLIDFVTYLPIIEIIRMIPITVQGIGVREGLFVLFFGTVGVGTTDAVLLATLIYLMATLMGLIGGGIYLMDALYAGFLARHRT